MFNGIIKNTGVINQIRKKRNSCSLEVMSSLKLTKSEIGSSISCSGACLSVEKVRKNLCEFYLSKETLDRTNFKYSNKGDILNLEKSLKYGKPISGHFIQGHVDTTCIVKKIKLIGKSWSINFSLSQKYRQYVITKGSISINGVSLTISKILKTGFQIVVIPQTLKFTNLIFLKEKDVVNVEFDIFGKYINNFLKK